MSSEAKETMQVKPMPKEKPSVANLGIKIFYDSMVAQNTKCVQIEWVPPFKQSAEIEQLLDEFL